MADSVKEQMKDVVSSAKRRVGLELPSAADDDGRIGVVRGAWRAFGEGDFDGFLDAFKDDAQWQAPSGKKFPGGETLDGPSTIKEKFIEDVGRTYTSFGFRPDAFVEAEDADAVIVLGTFEGDGVEGANLAEEAVQIWKFDGNAVAGVRVFVDTDPWPEVVTEQKLEEWEQEDKEKEEQEKEEAEGKSDSDDDSDDGESKDSDDEDSDDDSSKAKSDDDDSDEDSDDDDSDDQPKAESSDGSEAKKSDADDGDSRGDSSGENGDGGKRESREKEESA